MKKLKRRISIAFKGSSNDSTKNQDINMNSMASCLANDIDIIHVSQNQHGGNNYSSNNGTAIFMERQNTPGNSIYHNGWNLSTSINQLTDIYGNDTYYNNNKYVYSQENNNRYSQFIPCCYSSYININQFDKNNGNYRLPNYYMYKGNANNNSNEIKKDNNHPIQGIYYPQKLGYQNKPSNDCSDSTKFKLSRFSNNNLRNINGSRVITRPASIAALSNSSFSFSSSQDISSHYGGTNINISMNKISSQETSRNSFIEDNLKNSKEVQQLKKELSKDKFKIKSSNEDEISKPKIIMRNKKSNINGFGKEKIKKDRISSWCVSKLLPSKLAISFSNSTHLRMSKISIIY
uniref:Uncharacterized protein n=2 Tax=Strongyloides stercoralis TaxID=6248 RepID=A0AAF5DNX8_STRER